MTLKLHELTGSPNSVKVRIALAYKKLDYERLPVAIDGYPGDRSAIVALSRQPRLPVLEHGGTVIFDSGAILRYLEANFRATPPIFATSFEGHSAIEDWEQYARTKLSEPIGMLFSQAFAPEPDSMVVARANQILNENTTPLEDRLANHGFLVGKHLSVADIVTASALYLADMDEAGASDNPIAAFFQKNMSLGDGRAKTLAWMRRVIAHDPVKGARYR